ncbi:nodulin-related protein 1 [Euphorbia peplus]|nr:nodulin-related protein 1 [Euphorbia peplus]
MDSSLPNSHNKPKHHQPTSSELLSSAKYVASAAKAQLNHDQTQKLDKQKLGAAAGNLFEAASHYGKLDENKTYGKYVQKAETYLHQYHSSSHSSTASGDFAPPTTTTHNTSSHSSGQQGESESGFGDYLKMAQGFMKK